MIVFTGNNVDDCLVQAQERSRTGRWHGVFRVGVMHCVYADVYPAEKSAVRVAIFISGKERKGSNGR